MRIRRLGWAGVELEDGERRIGIDVLCDASFFEPFVGEPLTPLPEPSGPYDAALVTHLHRDHADAPALAGALRAGAPVLRPAPEDGSGLERAATAQAEGELAATGVATRVVAAWDTVRHDGLTFHALPAADGTGDPQVSWIAELGGRRIVHCGDTLFHGWWWRAAMRHGPFDLALLPVNGPLVEFPHRRPASPLPVAMTPEQAAVAAHLLGAALAVPIHYGTFSRAPAYFEPEPSAPAFVTHARERGVRAQVLEPGEALDL